MELLEKMFFFKEVFDNLISFQMFLCVVVFGLFHGILLLPVLLSLMGSHSEHDEDQLEGMVMTIGVLQYF